MYLKRHIDDYLSKWKKNKDKKPLIIKGARQIGKTESIRRFASLNYKNYIEINFVTNPEYKSIISDGYSPEAIIRNISLINTELKFIKNDTLIFFDEIQDFPDITTSLKFFAIDNNYDVICSGSMLGISYKTISSNSVGYKSDYVMHSLDFEEFLWAMGYNEKIADDIFEHMQKAIPFNDTEIAIFNKHFLSFCILGGMPEIIKNFVERQSFENSLAMQRQLLEDYRQDIVKYVQGLEQTKIINVFNHIPIQLARDNHKFQISKIAHGARYKNYWGCIEWLYNAGLINICYCLNFPELPLKGNYDESKYKIYFKDTGLLIASLDDESQDDLRANKNLGVYKGALYESIVSEALVKSGADLFYYKRDDSRLEEDFFGRTKNNLVPIEVKSTNANSKSLRTLIESEHYPDIKWGIKLINGNIGESENIRSFPHFCAFLLKRYLREYE